MEGERRIVTILFCDLQGSTAASEDLDPEEWAEIMNGAFEYMIRPVYKYEGFVARLMGDALLAFFGAPIAHEDDPQRAVLAGLEITEGIQGYQEDLKHTRGIDLDVRVGIHTGLVVVGNVGSDLRMEYTAMGEVINLASRMEQTAQPGTVQITAKTHKLVSPFFDFKHLGEVTVKGKSEPVQTFQLLGQKATVGRLRGIEGLTSPLIGRGEEIDQLQKAIDDVQNGIGGIACLIGEAGLGKSRLIRELHGEAFETASVQWFETTCLSYESHQPYGLFRRLIRRLSGAGLDDNPDMLREKISLLVKEISLEERAKVQRIFESLFGLESDTGAPPIEGEVFKGQLYTAMTSFWRYRATQMPVVLVIDDLHWSDPASIDLLLRMFPLTDQLPLQLICALRPDRTSPGWQIRSTADTNYPHRYTEINLRPLTSQDSGELVDNLLQISDLPHTMRTRILEKTEGNPFFVEEVVRTLIESGVVVRDENGTHWHVTDIKKEIDIPDNLQTLLLARIDNLEEEARWTLQLAAVIGRSFYYQVLARLVDAFQELDQQLLTLQRSQLIQEAARVPELEYVFRHVLVQEVAYEMILHRKRKDFHFKVGEALEELYPDHLQENAPLLAHHFELGGEMHRALKYYRMAGDGAFRLHAISEAIEHYSRALDIMEREAPGVEDNEKETIIDLYKHLYLRRGRALELNQQFEESAANYKELENLAAKLDNPHLLLASLVSTLTLHSILTPLFDPHKVNILSQRALTLAEELGDKASEAKIYWNLSIMNVMSRNSSKAIDFAQRSITIARELNLDDQLAYSLNDLARAYIGNGEFDKAKAVSDEAQKLFRKLDNLPMLADNILNAAETNLALGNYDQAFDLYHEISEIATSIDNQWLLAWGKTGEGYISLEFGNVSKGIEMISDSIELADRIGIDILSAGSRAHLAHIYLGLGDINRARELSSSALGRAQAENFYPTFSTWPLATVARVLIQLGDQIKSEAILKECYKHFDPNDFIVIYVKQVPLAAAELALSNGDSKHAVKLMDELIDQLYKKRARSLLPEALIIKGKALALDGLVTQAMQTFQEAHSEAEWLGERRLSWIILAELAKLEALQGNTDGADELRRQAWDIISYIKDHLENEELRASFLGLPEVRALISVEENIIR
jgi:predicted ATPase/class 3 adenylate cyclase